ncbi:very long chain fatty acid elongase 4-like [Lineus longissimus]|uniref:very long chain fatty acid elongase 4-like n=1 Tax=Lineus longissimus TaxID=88925 RepID=UPI002B4DBDD0
MASTVMTTISNISNLYEDFIISRGDPRVQSWPLLKTPTNTVAIIVMYLLMVKLGPRLMRDRKPFDLRWTLVPFNAFLVCLSTYIFYECISCVILSGYTLLCMGVDYSNSPLALRMARVCWWFFISKFIEMFDSLIFILRKKNSQLSFLHVYHHTTTAAYCWIGANYLPGGNSYFCVVINSFVHMIMYSYYGLSAIGPHMQKYLWWKKYLTWLQLVQFIANVYVGVHAIFVSQCDFSRAYSILGGAYSVSLAILFSHFYRQAYHKPRARKHDAVNGKMENGKAELITEKEKQG